MSEAQNAQVALDFAILSLGGFKVTVALSFAPNALPYSIERLRACGWQGKNIRQLDGVDRNEIDLELFYDTFNGRQRLKAEIRTSSTFKLEYQMKEGDLGAFASDVLDYLNKSEGDAPAPAAAPSKSPAAARGRRE